MKKTFLLPIMLILIFSLQLSSCKKEEEKETKGKFTVTVTLNNDPIEDVEVSIDSDDGNYEAVKNTDSQGKVVFNNLEPGRYSFSCYYIDDWNGVDYFGTSYNNKLRAGENKKITIELY